MDSYLMRFANVLTRHGAKFLFRWGSAHDMLFFLPAQVGIKRRAAIKNLFEDTPILLLWVDAKHDFNLPTSKLMSEKGTAVVFVNSTKEVKDFLAAYQEKSASDRAKIRLVSNRAREKDGGETAGESLGSWFKSQEMWRGNSFMLFCGNPALVKAVTHDPKNGVFVTSDITALLKFGTERDLL
jgi:hypothetical protein